MDKNNERKKIPSMVRITRNFSSKEISRIVLLSGYVEKSGTPTAYVEIIRQKENNAFWRAEFVCCGFVREIHTTYMLEEWNKRSKALYFKQKNLKDIIQEAKSFLNISYFPKIKK